MNFENNSSMNTAIIFLSIFILVISLMLEIKININFDLYSNELNVCIYLFNLRIICIKIYIIGFYYKINNSKKLKRLNIFITKEEEYLLKQIKLSIVDKLYYEHIVFDGSVGVGNAKDTALLSGYLIMLLNYCNIILKSKKHGTNFEYSICQNYVNKNLEFNILIKVFFTIFDLLFAIIMSFYKRGKYAKEREKQRQHR